MSNSSSSSSVIIPRIEAILILDTEGNRIAAKYFPQQSNVNGSQPSIQYNEFKDYKQQSQFEKKLNTKLNRNNSNNTIGRLDSEILLMEQFNIIYKFITDITICIISIADENELMIYSICQALEESLNQLLKGQVSKKTLIENLDLVLLTIDEIIHDGLILENDSNLIIQRVCMTGQGNDKDIPLAEQSFTQALQSAKDQFYKSFRS